MTENEFKEMIADKTNEWLINKVLKLKDAYQVEATYLNMVCQSLAKQLETGIVYNSINEAVEQTGKGRATISRWLKNGKFIYL